jgi:lipopolysaccharide transport system permease protein
MIREAGSATLALVGVFKRHRALLAELTRREMRFDRIGLLPGVVWQVSFPILLVGFYIFLFSTVFEARNGPLGPSGVLYILAGLVPWLFTADVLGRSSTAIVGGASLVKHLLFPVEVLPLSVIAASLLSFAIQSVILLGVSLIQSNGSRWMLIMALPLLGLHLIALIGMAMGLSAVGVYLRDLGEVVRIMLTVGLFAAPILYPFAALPRVAQMVLLVNPFTHMVTCYQDVFFDGAFAHPWSWPIFAAFAVIMFVLGALTMRSARIYFANFL